MERPSQAQLPLQLYTSTEPSGSGICPSRQVHRSTAEAEGESNPYPSVCDVSLKRASSEPANALERSSNSFWPSQRNGLLVAISKFTRPPSRPLPKRKECGSVRQTGKILTEKAKGRLGPKAWSVFLEEGSSAASGSESAGRWIARWSPQITRRSSLPVFRP